MNNELIYLACPYTHTEHYIMVARFNMVNKVAAKLMESGKYIFSPISHTHPLAEANVALPRDWNYWKGYARRMLSACDRIIVLRLPGWNISTGVMAEINISKEIGVPVEYMDYEWAEWISIVEKCRDLEDDPRREQDILTSHCR